MATLNKSYFGPVFENPCGCTLIFDWGSTTENTYPLPKKYEHVIVFTIDGEMDGKVKDIDDIYAMDILFYDKLKPVIDEPDALPDWYFDFVEDDGVTIIEKNISLRDFIKKYVFNSNILEDIKMEIEKVVDEKQISA